MFEDGAEMSNKITKKYMFVDHIQREYRNDDPHQALSSDP